MQFLLMCCIDEQAWTSLSDAQRGQVMEQYDQFIHKLKQSGCHMAGAMLDSASRAVTVRQRNGKPLVTDGPFAETKEQLGGYHLIECRDREEAIALASQIPALSVGCTVEVRAILQST